MAKFDEAFKLFKEKQSLDEVLNALKNPANLPGPVSNPLQDADKFPYTPSEAQQQMEETMGGPLTFAKSDGEPDISNLPPEENREPAGLGEVEEEDSIDQSIQPQAQPPVLPSSLEQNISDVQEKIEPAKPFEQQEETPEEKAIRLSGENRVAAAIQRGTANIGRALASSGIGRKLEGDEESLKLLEEGVNRPIEILKFQKEQEKISQDLQNAQKMADPNSDISRMTRSMLGQVGLSSLASKNISAQDLKNAGIDVDSLLARKIQMDQTRAMREQSLGIKEQARVSDMAARLAPKVQNKQYEKMITLNNQVQIMKESVDTPNPQTDTAMIYAFVKSLDPDSVVREGEIAFVQASRSIPTRVKSSLLRGLEGQTLTPEERKNILDFAQNAANLQQKAWKVSAAPYLEQARKLNIPEQMIIPDIAMEENSGNAIQENKNLPPTMTIRRLKDGKIKTLKSSEAEKYLRSDEFERVK
jgi:hypothetical protein